MAGLLLAAALLIAAYWLGWLVHRSLVASETGAAYTQFEDAFPAGRRLAGPVPGRRAVLPLDGAAGGPVLAPGRGRCRALPLRMDVLYDLQHGVWGKGANGVMELVINVVTLALSSSSCAGPGSVATLCLP